MSLSSAFPLQQGDGITNDDDSDEDENRIVVDDILVLDTDRKLTKEESEETELVQKPSIAWKFIRRLKNGPLKTVKGDTTHYVCQLCIDSKKKPFKSCLIKLFNDTPSNGTLHLQKFHNVEFLAAKESDDPNSSTCKMAPPVETLVCIPNYLSCSQTSGLGMDSITTVQGGNAIDQLLQQGQDNLLSAVQFQLVRVIANHHLALSFSQSADVCLLLQLASRIKRDTYQPLTRGCQDRILFQLFDMFTSTVKSQIQQVKAYYSLSAADEVVLHAAGLAQSPGWITVMHDGWDATQRSMLGVSVAFIDPRNWKLVKIAIGLGCAISHKAIDCADTALQLLERVGIYKSDISFSVNDTTSASAATGKILQEGDNEQQEPIDGNDDNEYDDGDSDALPTCRMHVSSLAIEHACGKRRRSKNKEVVDSFEVFENLRLRHRKCVNFIFSSKAKQRYKDYCERNAAVSQDVIRVSWDNDTRIAGTLRMFQEQLRVRFCEQTYFGQELDRVRTNYCVADHQWLLTAEFEAVIRGPAQLNFSTQVDVRPTIGTSWLYVVRAKLACQSKEYDVVNILPAKTDEMQRWDGSASFKSLPKITKKIKDMTEDARLLRSRLQKEFDHYFPSPDKNQLIAMMVDPVMFTVGQEFLRDVNKRVGQDQNLLLDNAMTKFVAVVRKEAKRVEILESARLANQLSAAVVDSTKATTVDVDGLSDSDDDDDKIVASVRRNKTTAPSAQQRPTITITKLTPAQLADEEINRWINQVIDWNDVLHQQKLAPEKWNSKKLEARNPFYLVEVVDVLAWWHTHANEFRLISRVAQRYLALPDANGFQERAFSCAKFVDHALRQRLSASKFEMLTLLAFNKEYIQQIDSPASIKKIIDSIRHAPAASDATKRLIEWFDLKGTEEEETMEQLLHTAIAIEGQSAKSNKRPRQESK
jgi:hypothetical protein